MKSIKINLLLINYLVILPLIFGIFIYIAFRDTNIYLYYIFKNETLKHIDIFNWISSFNINSFIIYSLPDGLWVFLSTNIFLIIWNGDIVRHLFWVLLPLTIGILYEYMQYTGILSGTFDFYDIIIMFISAIVSLSFYYFWRKL
jgi:hypothetical protein